VGQAKVKELFASTLSWLGASIPEPTTAAEAAEAIATLTAARHGAREAVTVASAKIAAPHEHADDELEQLEGEVRKQERAIRRCDLRIAELEQKRALFARSEYAAALKKFASDDGVLCDRFVAVAHDLIRVVAEIQRTREEAVSRGLVDAWAQVVRLPLHPGGALSLSDELLDLFVTERARLRKMAAAPGSRLVAPAPRRVPLEQRTVDHGHFRVEGFPPGPRAPVGRKFPADVLGGVRVKFVRSGAEFGDYRAQRDDEIVVDRDHARSLVTEGAAVIVETAAPEAPALASGDQTSAEGNQA
jgi:hypothetical protein